MPHSIAYGARSGASDDGLLAKLRRSWADYLLYRATVQELSQLSDRELADLGIHRAAINEIASQSIYRA